MRKINWKTVGIYSVWVIIIALLVYSRFINLSWGLPYPMHPDERNMAVAVQSLSCNISDLRQCGNPHFFAYGQFPLYISYIGVFLMKFFDGDLGTPISFQEAVFSLRTISALVSVLTVFVMIGITNTLLKKDKKKKSLIFHIPFLMLVFTFSPVFIQFSHFGTTESLLILFYSLIVYYSLLYIRNKIHDSRFLVFGSILCGLSLATKVSTAIYLIIPFTAFFLRHKKKAIVFTGLLLFFSAVLFILFSPHTIISFNEFFASMRYESGVALGQPEVFYTRQFAGTVPILFQMIHVFPYALGWPVFLLGVLGILGLSWKEKELYFLRFSFFVVFLPNAFMYAKWTRFIAPAFPLMMIFAVLFLLRLRIPRFLLYVVSLILLIPGIAFLSVYKNPDVRFQATDWINKNIPYGARILSETANVVDIPLGNANYRPVSFNFYDLDEDEKLRKTLPVLIVGADYIIVPSRRIFKNHPGKTYPLLNKYYKRLFSGELGFREVVKFTSYPRITILGKKIVEFPDEDAEETWTVFDHPVIRIYSKK